MSQASDYLKKSAQADTEAGAETAKAPGRPQPQSKRSPNPTADVKQVSTTAMALRNAKQKQVAVAVIQRKLEESAALYYSSNFDDSLLPPDGEQRGAIKELAQTMQQADQFTFGDFYAAPGIIDVTVIAATSDGLSFSPAAYFAPANECKQLSGGK